MDDPTFIRTSWIMLLVGIPVSLWGLAAWTGRYRGWVYLGRGYRMLAMLPGGLGLIALGASPLVPMSVGTFLFGFGFLCFAVAFGMAVLTLFIKDRWYPRWYHKMPGRQW